MNNDFVRLEKEVPGIQFSLRYSGFNNFMGKVVPGYNTNDRILCTKLAAMQLCEVQKDVQKDGYDLVFYDAYRPVKAVKSFLTWSTDNNFKNKEIFYPDMEKESIFSDGFIAKKSAHSRGSTVDLTLIESGKCVLDAPRLSMRKLVSGRSVPFYDDNSLDMASSFDLFDVVTFVDSHEITKEQRQRRRYLQRVMVKYGFVPYEKEWWHFTLQDEPFPNTYFDFDIKK